MASYTGRAVRLLGRINTVNSGLQKSVNRVTYATGLSINPTHGNKSSFDRGGRGPANRPPWRHPTEPRTEKMPVDQDWTAVYPAAASFRPGSVPLPVRMGYPVKGGVPPEKNGNLELLKIPNFLHLTPVAIRKHCDALKPFCTEWPAALDTDAKRDELFPIKVETTDYVSAGPSVRNPAARVVTLRVKLSCLNLDDHARKKMLKLAGERYCRDTDVLTITTDSCPLRQQNRDHAMYLLTVLYHESWKTEAWEAEQTRADMDEYSWEGSPSQRSILDALLAGDGGGEEVRERLLESEEVLEYKDSVTRLMNEGESESTVTRYKDAVKKVLHL